MWSSVGDGSGIVKGTSCRARAWQRTALVKHALILLLVTVPAAAQELFPRFSVTGGAYFGNFSTDARVDPAAAAGGGEGTALNIERDLGLESRKDLRRLTAQWRPLNRHELAGSWFTSSRTGFANIDREIRFRDSIYPVRAAVTTGFDLDYWDATYTYWARKSERDGFGVMLGAAGLKLDAVVTAQAEGQSVAATQRASTDVPVAMIGAQTRVAIIRNLIFEASGAALPHVTLDQYSGRALSAGARLEYRIVRAVGIGAAYNYFRLDGNVDTTGLRGNLKMRVDGAEAYLRLGW